jgi:hypothetical protein
MIRNGLGSTVAALGMVLGTMAPHGQAWAQKPGVAVPDYGSSPVVPAPIGPNTWIWYRTGEDMQRRETRAGPRSTTNDARRDKRNTNP